MPAILIAAYGIYTHPPPPPKKLPAAIATDFFNIVKSTKFGSLALVPFLSLPEIQAFCKKHHAKTLSEIHQSLSNQDYLRAILQKHKMLHFPQGASRMAVFLDWKEEESKSLSDKALREQQYIQFMDDDGDEYIIICFFQAQAEMFKQSCLTSLTIDVNYKHVAVSGNIEIIWGWYSPISQRVIPLVRIFTNSETSHMFTLMYSKVFSIFKDKYGIDVKFKHLHGSGLVGITVDQEFQAVMGFCMYLYALDPQKRKWIWHARHTIRFCKVHFQRGVEKYCNMSRSPNSLWSQMMSLLDAGSEETYDAICEELKKIPSIAAWAKHKKSNLIRFGINRHCNDMESNDWDLLPSHTNTVEVLHEISYRWSGRYAALKKVVDHCRLYDANVIQGDANFRLSGITHTYRDTSLTGRFIHQSKQGVKKKNARAAQAIRARRGNIIQTFLDNPIAQPIASASALERLPQTPVHSLPSSSARSQSSAGINSGLTAGPSSARARSVLSFSESVADDIEVVSQTSSSGVVSGQKRKRNPPSPQKRMIQQRLEKQADLDLKAREIQLQNDANAALEKQLQLKELELNLQQRELELKRMEKEMREGLV